MGGGVAEPTENLDAIDAQGCPALLSEDKLRTFALDMAPEQWAALDADFHDLPDLLAGTPPKTYYPATFHLGGEAIPAMVRLKGQSSWGDTVTYDANPKMQFVIAFDREQPAARFHGLAKLVLDMPRSDWTFLNERVANAWMRRIGLMAPCSNSAKLIINGSYYGLYVAEESVGDRMVKRAFPANPDGDLFKGGLEPETNKAAPNWTRNQMFWDAQDISAVASIVDLPRSLEEWASEAILNDGDGYYGGSHNFYIYDQGAAGYTFLPADLDSSIEWMSVFTGIAYRQHPIFWWEGRPFPQPPGQHYLAVMNDATWRMRYVDALDAQLGKWDARQVAGWLDRWSAQIAEAVDADPRKWATTEQFQMAIAAAREEAVARPAFLRDFVSCERGAPGDDQDADGVPWCNDCRDDDASVRPGAPEVCGNNVDDDCDGVVDEGCSGQMTTATGVGP